MKDMPLIFTDLETGGLDPVNNSILSLGFILVVNDEIRWKDSTTVESPIYNVTAGAMDVNKLDLYEDVYKPGIPEEAICADLVLGKLPDALGSSYPIKPKIAGWNAPFDRAFLKAMFARHGKNIDTWFDYHVYDLSSISFYLYEQGFIPLFKNSGEAFHHFNIYKPELHHTAIGDAEMSYELYKIYQNILNGKTKK